MINMTYLAHCNLVDKSVYKTCTETETLKSRALYDKNSVHLSPEFGIISLLHNMNLNLNVIH